MRPALRYYWNWSVSLLAPVASVLDVCADAGKGWDVCADMDLASIGAGDTTGSSAMGGTSRRSLPLRPSRQWSGSLVGACLFTNDPHDGRSLICPVQERIRRGRLTTAFYVRGVEL